MAEIGGSGRNGEIGGAPGSVRDSGNGRRGGVAVFVVSAYAAALGVVAKAEKLAYSGGVGGRGSLRGIGRYRECGGVGVLPRLKRLRTAAESAGTEVYAARSWQTGR